MYAASFGDNAGLGSWLSNSRVVHGVAQAPQGPYTLTDVALGPLPNTRAWDSLTQHNPAVQKDPISGTYLVRGLVPSEWCELMPISDACATRPPALLHGLDQQFNQDERRWQVC